MRLLRSLALVLLVLPALLPSCQKETFSDGALAFSADTVIFDTVFTTIGSVTKQFKVYNRSTDRVLISDIALAGGTQSKYRINVDGRSGVNIKDVEIEGNDSIFVFVEVTLDPNNAANPMMVTDSVVFVTNGVMQDVDLAACGWDAIFQYPTDYLPGLGSYSVIDCNTVWNSTKPIVIYGWAVVDSLCTLTITEGTNIFIHKYSGMLVYRGGTLHVHGTKDLPVTFASDRIDEFYRDQAGEWDRILFYEGSVGNTIDHAIIKNGSIGIQVNDPYANSVSASPQVLITNTQVHNMSAVGLLCYGANVSGYNNVFGNAGQHSMALVFGGKYNFKHCTLGNSWSTGNRQSPLLLINNWFEYEDGLVGNALSEAYFGNCIIWGSNTTEVSLDPVAGFTFSPKFDRCLIRADEEELDMTDPLKFANTVLNEDPEFVDPVEEQDFSLDTLSPAKDRADILITNSLPELFNDLLGNPRFNDAAPDLGAIERVE
jgi:hypothetical protein